jgi:hypothetical protein
LRDLEQRGIVLDQPFGAVEACRRVRGKLVARAERNKTVEDRLIALAEQPLVIIRSDAEIEAR